MIRSTFNRKIENARNPVNTRLSSVLRAGDERIELPPKVLETPIIPFANPLFQLFCKISFTVAIIHIKATIVKVIMHLL